MDFSICAHKVGFCKFSHNQNSYQKYTCMLNSNVLAIKIPSFTVRTFPVSTLLLEEIRTILHYFIPAVVPINCGFKFQQQILLKCFFKI